ncbi:MAG: hypothetical protein NTU79_10935 [Planctomycetota bacterium]|nr:hypothetical protein [Planctomycetota bacterium]
MISFTGSQTLSGTGSIVFGNNSGFNGVLINNDSSGVATLTIAKDMTVRGPSGFIGTNPQIGGSSGAILLNRGTIQADVVGGAISLNSTSSQNSGILIARSGTTLSLARLRDSGNTTGLSFGLLCFAATVFWNKSCALGKPSR